MTQEAGIDYRWSIDGKRPLNILQSIGNGCAFLDFDNDGNLDILLVGPHLALYRGDGKGHFVDVTHQTGLDRFAGHFLGCAVGDYDNDGYPDIYISAYHGGLLLHNENASASGSHNRIFRDVTRSAGVKPQPWGTSAIFFDADNDGKLDLYIGNYVDFGPNTQPQLCNTHGVMTGCGPLDYKALRGVLYRNLGKGYFKDVTIQWGLDKVSGRTLGLASAPSLVSQPPNLAPQSHIALANDETPGDLMVFDASQPTRLKAKNIGDMMGMALAGTQVYGGMGIDWGDYDNDGRLDLVIATYQNQGKMVLHNQGDQFNILDTVQTGMASSLYYVAFGVKWLDYDNDGWLDLLFANGHVHDNASTADIVEPFQFTYRQPTVLYRNLQNGKFMDVSAGLTGGAELPIVGRGLAIGDYDNDGRIDGLIVDAEGKPVLLHNISQSAGHWLEVTLRGTHSNRDGIGSLVMVNTGKSHLTRLCTTGGSFFSASDRRVHIGLGDATGAKVSVRWPDGTTKSYGTIRANQRVTLTE